MALQIGSALETSKLLTLNGTGGFTSAFNMSSYNSSISLENWCIKYDSILFQKVKGYSQSFMYKTTIQITHLFTQGT